MARQLFRCFSRIRAVCLSFEAFIRKISGYVDRSLRDCLLPGALRAYYQFVRYAAWASSKGFPV